MNVNARAAAEILGLSRLAFARFEAEGLVSTVAVEDGESLYDMDQLIDLVACAPQPSDAA